MFFSTKSLSQKKKKKKKTLIDLVCKNISSRKTTQYNSQVYFTWKVTFVSNFSEGILNSIKAILNLL